MKMSKKIFLEDAERILSDVRPEQCFWVNNGPIVRNLQEMANALTYMKDETFKHHVNEQKNDISNWVMDVLKDEELASNIMKVSSKEKILNKIKKKINFLEKRIEKERNLDITSF